MDPDFSDILSILVASVIDCEKEVIVPALGQN